VKDAHGLRGELYVQLHAKSADWLSGEKLKIHLQKLDGTALEFEVERAKPFKAGLIVKLAGMNDRTAAEGWRKAQVYVSKDLLVSEPGERLFLDQLLDFVVLDNGVEVGRVAGFSTNGAQDLLRVERPGGEVLVPLVDAFILRIEFEQKRLLMSLPEGLLDVEAKK